MSSEDSVKPLWIETPLIYSSYISDYLGCSVYLKLENVQTAQSFKYRGISRFIQKIKEKHGPSVHLLAASGGNAGFAAAVAARALELNCTVYLPSIASEETRQLLRNQNAKVVVAGDVYSETVAALQQALKNEPNAVFVPAYEDPALWEGHGSMIKEIKEQLSEKPDAIFCNVGGGGLLGGIMGGCQAVGWDDVPVVAVETHGSNCFYHSISLNTDKFADMSATQPQTDIPSANDIYDVKRDSEYSVNLAHIRKITSRASSLGASSAAPGVVRKALDRSGGIKCVCVSDEMAMYTAKAFGEDHKLIIELACAATLTAAYNRELFSHLVESGQPRQKTAKTIVFIVCGGIKVSFNELMEHHDLLKGIAESDEGWPISYNGQAFNVSK
ncbi:tryptophan synthase beta subunit-like PLP-dependent enzyme [Hygrophoropsis aurantiaca]|uniref:Tryptophan synthase beta subunit-like PLP-dependent enzyme n=1 Tax=Hygrophoropsis aurantiaca TaxID=72124 RepID=A0ACB8ARR5_9AGAM|nr:tryptophan synthase beta subunit-like PLP-dependent enzyme [Hygrophoropsis aurantiaca]